MEYIEPIINRVEMILGDTYNIRYTYNPVDCTLLVKVTRNDSDWKLEMIFSEYDLQLNQTTIAGAMATAIVREFNEWLNNDKED